MPRYSDSKALKLKPPVIMSTQAVDYLNGLKRKEYGELDAVDADSITLDNVRYLPNIFIVAAINAKKLSYQNRRYQAKPEFIQFLPFKPTIFSGDLIMKAIESNFK